MAVENEETPAVETPAVETPAVETPVAETPATEGPKSLTEALDAGLEAVPQRTKEEADKAAEKVKGEKGGEPGKDDEKDDAGEAAEKEPEKEGEEKELDHVNDPIPKELKEATQERIRSLIGYVKERDEALVVQGKLINAIQGTGTTAEEFASTIRYLEAFHSNDPKQLELALDILKQNMEDIALRLGRDVPGIDFLEGHQDLKDAVKYGQITQQHASELARGRTAAARTQAFDQQRQTATQAEQAAKVEKDTAITSLNELGAHLAKTDPDYQRKYDLLVEPLKAVFERIPPSQWKATFEKAYGALKLPAAAAPAASTAPPAGAARDPTTGLFVKANKGQPIRPVQPAGQGAKAPNSALEALSGAIENLR